MMINNVRSAPLGARVFVRDENGDTNPVLTRELFENKRVVIFGLPGAFTPTCSSRHLPEYDERYDEIIDAGIDEVYCVSVNDSFTMGAWFDNLGISNVDMIADGSAEFTRAMGMLCTKHNLGFGERSWRYSAVIDNGYIETMFSESCAPTMRMDEFEEDPFEVSDADTMIEYLTQEDNEP